MSVYYIYANLDKAQFFCCGLLLWSGRFSAVGRGPGARALAILLSDRGTWKNDRISVIADGSKEFDDVSASFVNIDVEVKLMLMDVDGLEWIERELDETGPVFTEMCAIAILMRRQDVIKMLDTKFGIGKWQRQYKNRYQGGTDLWSQNIVDAMNRELKILV